MGVCGKILIFVLDGVQIEKWWVCCTVGVETGDIGGVEKLVMCGEDFSGVMWKSEEGRGKRKEGEGSGEEIKIGRYCFLKGGEIRNWRCLGTERGMKVLIVVCFLDAEIPFVLYPQ